MSLSAADKMSIHELNAEFFRALDSHDVVGWCATFADDGVFASPYGEFGGTEALEQFLRKHIDAGYEDGSCHLAANMTVTGDGDRAQMRSYVVKLRTTQPPAIVATGFYEDELTCVPDGWRFIRRTLTINTSAVTADGQQDGSVK